LPSGNLVVKARFGAADAENSKLREDLDFGFKKLTRLNA